jgi:hypothetical protein
MERASSEVARTSRALAVVRASSSTVWASGRFPAPAATRPMRHNTNACGQEILPEDLQARQGFGGVGVGVELGEERFTRHLGGVPLGPASQIQRAAGLELGFLASPPMPGHFGQAELCLGLVAVVPELAVELHGGLEARRSRFEVALVERNGSQVPEQDPDRPQVADGAAVDERRVAATSGLGEITRVVPGEREVAEHDAHHASIPVLLEQAKGFPEGFAGLGQMPPRVLHSSEGVEGKGLCGRGCRGSPGRDSSRVQGRCRNAVVAAVVGGLRFDEQQVRLPSSVADPSGHVHAVLDERGRLGEASGQAARIRDPVDHSHPPPVAEVRRRKDPFRQRDQWRQWTGDTRDLVRGDPVGGGEVWLAVCARPLDRLDQVAPLGFERPACGAVPLVEGGPCGVLAVPGEPTGVTCAGAIVGGALLLDEQPNGDEQAMAHRGVEAARDAADPGAIEQRLQHVRGELAPSTRPDDGLRGIHREPIDEHGQSAERPAMIRIEQFPRPLERRAQRPMTRVVLRPTEQIERP